MFLHRSANLEWNLFRTCDPWHMHQDWTIEHWEEVYVYTPIRVAHLLFRTCELPHGRQQVQVAFRAQVRPVLVEVHQLLCASSMSVDSSRCHFGKESSRPIPFHEPLPGNFLSQSSVVCARETELPTSSHLGLQCEVCWSWFEFSLLQCPTTLLWPLWRYSTQGACWTVLAVPDLLTLLY